MQEPNTRDVAASSRRFGARRHGLSVLEFMGCLMAVVGGAWLGAIYLGIDVHHLAYIALSESTLLEKVPEQWRPAEPPPAEGTPTPAELAQAVQVELVALNQEIKALRNTREGKTSKSGDAASVDSTEAETVNSGPAREATLAYWNRIAEIVRGEVALELDAESAATSENATKVAALKARIGRFSAAAVQSLPTDGVDPAAVELGKALAGWYERGGDLYDQAVRIWESPARGANSPALSKDWEQAQLQHRNEGQLLHKRIAATRDSLGRRFGEGFAEFVEF